jgi:hypothetical protein
VLASSCVAPVQRNIAITSWGRVVEPKRPERRPQIKLTPTERGRAAGALIAVVISGALIDVARGALASPPNRILARLDIPTTLSKKFNGAAGRY